MIVINQYMNKVTLCNLKKLVDIVCSTDCYHLSSIINTKIRVSQHQHEIDKYILSNSLKRISKLNVLERIDYGNTYAINQSEMDRIDKKIMEFITKFGPENLTQKTVNQITKSVKKITTIVQVITLTVFQQPISWLILSDQLKT
ncbi:MULTISPECIES: hypothetical protein [unclassified Fusibacter]|uniref:hypothetical protein n=1 Tax=unclassified Fusibacter TaxID=2624464 RepID=UPI001011DF78|nr:MULTISPECIES: hypothetical protein [unclassified Fusibacter]MCK8060312.1 hypothetical protein [Fusibacter sp. A2]NPE20399.1 hypothetical protein [Fusibacter sp. A1]RXV63603.1 hypothetical protein DWB64_01105 [Fusibacter sp. A1]